VLAVVVGRAGEALDRIVTTLIRHQIPVVREHRAKPVAEVHWYRSHRGPVVRILVNPAPEHWWVGATLGWTAILVPEGAVDTPDLDLALARGVLAVVSPEDIEERLIPVVGLVAAGYLVMDPVATRPFTDSLWARSAELPMAPPALTPRERDILLEIGRNHTVRQTARALGIALKTVENAQGHLFRKLGVHNRAAALAKAYSLGLLQPG
jgi:DNA-binding CsgD family transcriptional regulator